MRKLVTLLCAGLVSSTALAQNYVNSTYTGTDAAYDYLAAGTSILAVPSTEVLSSAQTLPFSWNYYGSAVTSYKVSDNGYITFNTTESTSYNSNVAIPNAAEPNNAIYAFWDDFNLVSGSGTPDAVKSWTYGTAPTRTHVIQWHSVTPLGATTFTYATILIHECGDFEIVLPWATSTGLSGTVGAENSTGTSASSIFGSPTMTYPSGTTSVAADDRVYRFIWDGTSYDLTVESIDLSDFVTVGNNAVTGDITNLGGATVSSFDLHYSVDGGTPVDQSISGVSIAPGSTYSFSHSTLWNVATGGQNFTLCVWADNINGNADERTCNDQICDDLFSNLGITGDKTVLVEEFTGAWCGYCPDGEVVVDDILATYPGDVISVSVHDGDGMEYAEGIRSAFAVSAYPNANVDRYLFAGEAAVPHSRGVWKSHSAARTTAYTPVNVAVGSSYDAGTRMITATVEASFVDYSAGDLRLGLMIAEDHVTGTGTGYNQVNYYNTTAGHPYYGAGDPILGYDHRRVLRTNPNGPHGLAGVIPANVSPGSTYSNTWTYTLPAGYDDTEISIIGFVYNYKSDLTKGEIYNSGTNPLGVVLGADKPTVNGFSFNAYPNPVNQGGYAQIELEKATPATLEVFNTLGQREAVLFEGNLSAGSHVISYDVSEVPAGVYFLILTTPEGKAQQKVIVSH